MFLTASQIAESISKLADVHPFYGITFLTCKKGSLSVGRAKDFPMDSKTAEFMQKYHRIDPSSEFFFSAL